MVRLRQMHRVDDVAARRSPRAGVTDGSALRRRLERREGCGSFYTFELTVVFDESAPAASRRSRPGDSARARTARRRVMSLSDRDRKIAPASSCPCVCWRRTGSCSSRPSARRPPRPAEALAKQEKAATRLRPGRASSRAPRRPSPPTTPRSCGSARRSPRTVDMPSLIVQLDSAAQGHRHRVHQDRRRRAHEAAAAAPARAPAAGPVAAAATPRPAAPAQSAPGGAAEPANNTQGRRRPAGRAKSGADRAPASTPAKQGGVPVGGGRPAPARPGAAPEPARPAWSACRSSFEFQRQLLRPGRLLPPAQALRAGGERERGGRRAAA